MHTCAISTRMLACWGNNQFGQVVVPNHMRKATLVSACAQTCAVKDGELNCWGRAEDRETDVPQGLRGYVRGNRESEGGIKEQRKGTGEKEGEG